MAKKVKEEVLEIPEQGEVREMVGKQDNPLDVVTGQELQLVIGEQQVEIYRLRRNQSILINKLNELEAELKKVRKVREKKRGKK